MYTFYVFYYTLLYHPAFKHDTQYYHTVVVQLCCSRTVLILIVVLRRITISIILYEYYYYQILYRYCTCRFLTCHCSVAKARLHYIATGDKETMQLRHHTPSQLCNADALPFWRQSRQTLAAHLADSCTRSAVVGNWCFFLLHHNGSECLPKFAPDSQPGELTSF